MTAARKPVHESSQRGVMTGNLGTGVACGMRKARSPHVLRSLKRSAAVLGSSSCHGARASAALAPALTAAIAADARERAVGTAFAARLVVGLDVDVDLDDLEETERERARLRASAMVWLFERVRAVFGDTRLLALGNLGAWGRRFTFKQPFTRAPVKKKSLSKSASSKMFTRSKGVRGSL